MHGRITVKIKDLELPLWFNNYSKVELAKVLLPKKKGYPSKPEEIQLLRAIQERATENHLVLMRDLVHAGHIGHVHATNSDKQVSKDRVAEYIAEADDKEIYEVWLAFLEAYGFNLDDILDEDQKKKRTQEKVKKEISLS